MNQQTINNQIRAIALINILIYDIDEIENDGLVFKQKIKYTGKAFRKELETFVLQLYKNMNEDAEFEYYRKIKEIENALKHHKGDEVAKRPGEVCEVPGVM